MENQKIEPESASAKRQSEWRSRRKGKATMDRVGYPELHSEILSVRAEEVRRKVEEAEAAAEALNAEVVRIIRNQPDERRKDLALGMLAKGKRVILKAF